MRQALDRFFGFGRHRTTLARDSFAGATTFIVMSYIIFVDPNILTGVKGPHGQTLPFSGVLTSTCLVAAVMTILMGVYTNRAYALAPGLGINAIVAFTLVGTLHLSFPSAMGLIVLEGLVVTAARPHGLTRDDHARDPARAEEGDRGAGGRSQGSTSSMSRSAFRLRS